MQGKLEELVNDRVFRVLLENSSDVHVICDIHGKQSYVSSTVSKVLGYSQAEALNLSHEEFFHPDDIMQIKRGVAKCLKVPGSSNHAPALRAKNKAGDWIWIEASLTNLLNDPQINGLIFNFRDVSDRKRAQFKLLKAQVFNKSILSSLTDHIAVVDSSGTIIAVNKAWDDFSLNNSSLSLTHTSVGSNYFAACQSAADAGDEIARQALEGIKGVLDSKLPTFSLEYPCHSPAEERWFTLTATAFGGSAARAVISHHNITERRLAQTQLSDSERRFRGLIENSPDGIVILSAEGVPTYVSPGVKSILGYSLEECLELNVAEITHMDDREFVTTLLSQSFANPGVALKSTPVRIKHKNGTWRWLDGVVTNMLHDPAINGIVDNFWDVTEQKNSEIKILKANRLYAFLSQINQAILRTKDDLTLFNEVCRIAVKVGKFKTAWIGLFNVQKDRVNVVAGCGMPQQAMELLSDYRFVNGGPFSAIVNGSDFVVKEIQGGDGLSFDQLISEFNYKSTILLAIRRFGSLIGVLNICSTETTVFEDDDVKLLLESTSEISFALNVFEKDKLRTKTEIALKENEARLNDAQAIAKVGSWEMNLSNLTVTWSAECYRIFETYDFAGTHAAFMQFVHPDDFDRVYHSYYESIVNKKDSRIEHRLVTAKGNVKTVTENWRFTNSVDTGDCLAVGTCQDITEQKAAQQTSQFKAHLLNTIGQAAVAINLEGKITYWNKAAEEIYGWSEREAIGREVADIIPFVVPADKAKDIKNKLQKGRIWSGEINIKRKDGSIIPISVTDTPIYDEYNRLAGSIAVSSDISEKKSLQKLLDRANSLALIGNYEFDLINKKLYWSDITRQIHEVPDDFVPLVDTAYGFYKEGTDREAINKAAEGALKNGTSYDLNLRIITFTGKEKWIRVTGETQFTDGVCTRIYGSFQDIHTLKTAEIQALKLYKQRDRILESIDDAFVTLDRDWKVTYWNRKAEELLATQKSDVLGKNVWECFPGEVGGDFYNHAHRAFAEDTVQQFEAFYTAIGIWVDVSCYPSKDGLSVYFRDISERKKQEVQLLELNKNLQKYTDELVLSNKGLEQFSYIISHNLRSPAANIMGIASELKSPHYDPETKELFLSELLLSVEKLDNVISDLNTILHVKSQIDELKEPVRLSRIIHDIEQSIHHIIAKENVVIITDAIEIDDFYTLKSYLYSILYNLISNGIKYRRRELDPVITITSFEDNGRLIISVKDNGTGIDLLKQKEHVFGLYKRFHPQIEGKGMGLFMVKTQVEALGGNISINSEVNSGTEFVIEFKI